MKAEKFNKPKQACHKCLKLVDGKDNLVVMPAVLLGALDALPQDVCESCAIKMLVSILTAMAAVQDSLAS